MTESNAERSSVSVPRAIAGSLLLNSLYDAEGQQRGGTIHLLRSLLPGDSPARAAALEEISEQPVNTSAMLAGLALGPLVSLVHDSATSREEAREQARRMRMAFAPVVGALGDRLRFGALQPSAAGGFLSAALIWPPAVVLWYLVGLGMKALWTARSWRIGLAGQNAVLQWLDARVLDRWIGTLQRLARVFLGLSIGFVGMETAQNGALQPIVFVSMLGIGLLLGRRGGSPFLLAWIAVAAALLLGVVELRG
jgi:hypothetical protein